RRSTSCGWPASAPTTGGWPTSAAATPSAGPASGRASSTTSTTPSRTCAGASSTACGAASSCRRSRPTSTGRSRSTTPTTTGTGRTFLDAGDAAIEAVRGTKEPGLRGGTLLPTIPPDVDWVKPLNHPVYDRLWAVYQDLEVPVNCHGGTGSPSSARVPSSAVI